MNRQPRLYLAPMEGVGALPFRRAIATIGGFDEACSEFLRVPTNAHVPSLVKKYNPNDLYPIPQAAQIMGSVPHLMAEMTSALAQRGAPRIDLNCGCPSNTVTGRGAGSSLLKDPQSLYTIAKAMVDATSTPVTAKLRSGFDDTSLIKENLLAAQEAGVAFITLHPRTKREGYSPPANWDLITLAVELLDIPVVGNGDICTPQDATRMLEQTGCHALMIGRGALINPFLFHEIRNSPPTGDLETYIRTFIATFDPTTKPRSQVNQLKQLCGYLYQINPTLESKRRDMLRRAYTSAEDFLSKALPEISASLDTIPSPLV